MIGKTSDTKVVSVRSEASNVLILVHQVFSENEDAPEAQKKQLRAIPRGWPSL